MGYFWSRYSLLFSMGSTTSRDCATRTSHSIASGRRRSPTYRQAYAVYYSVLAVPFLIPVYLTEAASILNWTKRMSVAIVLAGLVFLLFPAKLGYPPKGSDSWTWFEQLTSYVAGTHNLVPSLHVALSVITFVQSGNSSRKAPSGLSYSGQ